MRTLVAISILGLAATAGTAAADTAADDTDTSGDAAPPAPAVAQPKPKTLGVDAGIAAPTGDLADGVGFGLGALARFEMPVGKKLTATGRAGYIRHLAKESESGLPGGGGGSESTTSELLLFGGLRYAFSQTPTTAIYGAAELGIVNYRVSLESGGESMDVSDTNLGMTLGGGYRTGKLDLRANLFFPKADTLDALVVMATIGYDLTSF